MTLLTDTTATALDRVLSERSVRSVYQPLVELDTGLVVAYEALARGPQGSELERPDLLFAAARRAGRLTDLDVACRIAAVSGAQAAGLQPPYRLFVNAEPEALDGWRPGSASGDGQLPVTVIVELTERASAARPAQLLQTVARIRSYGWGVALDDVGPDPSSLALLPMLRPDVIKLDLRLVQQHPTGGIASIMNAVHAEAERSARSCSPRASRPRSTCRPREPSARRSGRAGSSAAPVRCRRGSRRSRVGRCRSCRAGTSSRTARRSSSPRRTAPRGPR